MQNQETLTNIEYNLIDIIKLIFINKKIIFLSTIASLLIGLLVAVYFFPKKQISITINPKKTDFMIDFQNLATLGDKYFFVNKKKKDKKTKNPGFLIHRSNLIVKFRENLYDKEIFKDSILENQTNEKKNIISKEKIDQTILSYIKNLSYKTLNKHDYLTLNLSLKTENVETDIQILKSIIEKTSKKIAKLEIERFNKFEDSLLFARSNQIKYIKSKFDILKYETKLLRNKHLDFLEDQYKIAKNLKMPNRSLKYFSEGEYYLRGYLSILEEIKIYKNKPLDLLVKLNPDFISLNKELLKAKSKIKIDEYREAFEMTPFAKGNLNTVSYDGELIVNYQINPFMIIFLSTFSGFLLSTFMILILNIYRNLYG